MGFSILGLHWKIRFLSGGGVRKKIIYRGELPKQGAWAVSRFKEGGLARKMLWCFLGEGDWYPNAQYDIHWEIYLQSSSWLQPVQGKGNKDSEGFILRGKLPDMNTCDSHQCETLVRPYIKQITFYESKEEVYRGRCHI